MPLFLQIILGLVGAYVLIRILSSYSTDQIKGAGKNVLLVLLIKWLPLLIAVLTTVFLLLDFIYPYPQSMYPTLWVVLLICMFAWYWTYNIFKKSQ